MSHLNDLELSVTSILSFVGCVAVAVITDGSVAFAVITTGSVALMLPVDVFIVILIKLEY
tara:strand:+ start:19 stop:198 length:180 start_codon:yes stop_codon:yes gene_type:complete